MAKARWHTRLRKARESIGFSLSEAVKLLKESEGINMHKTHLGQVERGECDLTATKFRALCKIYSCSSDWIFDLRDVK